MKKYGILNSEISKVLSDLGHTDQVVIADCGLPIPSEVKKIDLALDYGNPSFLEVYHLLTHHMKVEKMIFAHEIKEKNFQLLSKINQEYENIDKKFVSHEKLKELTKDAKAIIRTGENTPFANVILQAGVYFGE